MPLVIRLTNPENGQVLRMPIDERRFRPGARMFQTTPVLVEYETVDKAEYEFMLESYAENSYLHRQIRRLVRGHE